jgi:lysylphosphatidylglycerol synthetase-like protein (DUF2156 family)
MSTEPAQHLEPSLTKQADTDPGAHDHEAEVKHAWLHFRENAFFFAGFLSLILAAVAQYELAAQTNYYWIFGLGALRFGLIGFFMFSLVRPFSLIVATFLFTILFFGGMIYLSIWGSRLPYLGDPIRMNSEKVTGP